MAQVDAAFSDTYGDPIHVLGYEDGDLVSLDTRGITGFDFDKEAAVQLGTAILKAAGVSTVPISDIPSATNVSFNEAMLRLACVHKRTVVFRYQKQNGGFIESRRFNPERIVGEGDTLGAEGHDPDRNAPRRFNIGRIQGEVSFA